MSPVSLVHVSLDFGSATHKLGRLALANRRIYFEYEPEFLKSGLDVSPFKLPLRATATPCEDRMFEGLFGVFNDSLPDGWGRLLLDRQVRKHSIAPEQLTPLDRLTHVGCYGMGALTYAPDASGHLPHPETIYLDRLAAESSEILHGDADDVFAELLGLSGSSAGARPKVMLGVSRNRKKLIHGQQLLPAGYEHWMVKFASSSDTKDIGAVEYAYSRMARAAGLEVMPTHLFPAKKGAGYFGVKRFDRSGNKRLHMHTVSGLIHTDHRLPSLDYEQILRLTLTLTRDVKELEKILRLAAFNVFAHNRDDHAKNFSFLMDETGNWRVSPAYDLTFSGGPGGEHSTTVMGEGRRPESSHLLKLASVFGIAPPRATEIIDEVRAVVHRWPHYADEAGVSKASRHQISRIIAMA